MGQLGATGPPSEAARRPKIAVFDYEVNERSPSGSCHLRLLEGLHDEFDFTVFATEFDNPAPDRITWVRVPSATRPLAARYLTYYLTSGLLLRRHGGAAAFDLVQGVESYAPHLDLSYVHYCHAAYLRRHEDGDSRGLRARVRHLDHVLRARKEGSALARAGLLVVPSPGLAQELETEHGLDREAIRVVANPVDLTAFARPPDFDRTPLRAELGVADTDLLVTFVALGHFERKGLPCVLDALRLTGPGVQLTVVGGQADLIAQYKGIADSLGVGDRVRFVGLQHDVRPYLWAADAFVAPSSYEVFSLAPLQAAAAGLPLLVSDVPGVAPFFVEGVHGHVVSRDGADVARGFSELAAVGPVEREAMGAAARAAAHSYGVPRFVDGWRQVYDEALRRVER